MFLNLFKCALCDRIDLKRGFSYARSVASTTYRVCPECDLRFEMGGVTHCPEHNKALLVVSSDSEALIGKTISDRFTIESELGEGGFGAVYKAVQTSIDRPVAIKFLQRQHSTNEILVKRFYSEAKSISQLRNHHTIQLFDFGQCQDGQLYMVLELAPGKNLRHLIADDGPLTVGRIANIMQQVCHSLAEAHHQGIIHRDLKPENIMVEDRRDSPDFVKVLDFGIAKILERDATGVVTNTGDINGTPCYMSPEQIQKSELTGASDLYAIGVILYQAVTGNLPFDEDTSIATLMAHVNADVPDIRLVVPNLNEDFATLIMRLLSKDPKDRPASAEALRAKLLTFVDDTMALERVAPDLNTEKVSGLADTAVASVGLLREATEAKVARDTVVAKKIDSAVAPVEPEAAVVEPVVAKVDFEVAIEELSERPRSTGNSRWSLLFIIAVVMSVFGWFGYQHFSGPASRTRARSSTLESGASDKAKQTDSTELAATNSREGTSRSRAITPEAPKPAAAKPEKVIAKPEVVAAKLKAVVPEAAKPATAKLVAAKPKA
ncbi:MAG TPA: serine/threonine protein kinase, partial [Myxococcales bacterium]|nr:serine/threonine protein kinase [Myxococcales bacterium]